MASAMAASANQSLQYVSLVFQGIQFFSSRSLTEEITVTAEGIGETQNIAIENALNIAVQKAVGVLILSDQTVSNDAVIKNLVAQYSSGVVNSYEVKKCQGKPVSCEIVAKVSPWKFMRKLEGDSQTIQVNGNDLFMKHHTAKNALLQRQKVAEYYMSQIRQSGLDVVIKSVNIEPTTNDKARLIINYEVKWNKEFKTEIIKFLEKLEKDTVNNNSNQQIYIQWGPTGIFENRVRVNTYNESFRQMLVYHIYRPVHVKIDELNICEDIRHENVFTIDWYKVKRTIAIDVDSAKLKNINSLNMRVSC